MLSKQLVRELTDKYPELRIRLGIFVRTGKKFSSMYTKSPYLNLQLISADVDGETACGCSERQAYA